MKINQILKKHFFASMLTVAFFSLFFSACEKQDTPLPYSNMADFLTAKTPQSQIFTFDPTTSQTITGAQNTKITFNANSFIDAAGNVVTSTVRLEMKEIYKKGDMILSNKMTESNGALLESGGEFFLKATAGGQPVYLNQPYSMIVPIVDATSNPTAMDLFIGFQAADTFIFTWKPMDSIGVNVDTIGGQLGGAPYPNYNLYFDSLDWINLDYFFVNGNNTVTAIRALPVVTTTFLTSVKAYVVFTNINTVLELYYNGTTFQSQNVPIGEAATIVMIGMDGTQFYLGTQSITITNTNTISVPMSAVTEAQLITTINGL